MALVLIASTTPLLSLGFVIVMACAHVMYVLGAASQMIGEVKSTTRFCYVIGAIITLIWLTRRVHKIAVKNVWRLLVFNKLHYNDVAIKPKFHL